MLANNIRIASICQASNFPTAAKRGSASFNELLDFLESSSGILRLSADLSELETILSIFSDSSQARLVSFNELLKCCIEFSVLAQRATVM